MLCMPDFDPSRAIQLLKPDGSDGQFGIYFVSKVWLIGKSLQNSSLKHAVISATRHWTVEWLLSLDQN